VRKGQEIKVTPATSKRDVLGKNATSGTPRSKTLSAQRAKAKATPREATEAKGKAVAKEKAAAKEKGTGLNVWQKGAKHQAWDSDSAPSATERR
jgi:5'-3' exonuclease